MERLAVLCEADMSDVYVMTKKSCRSPEGRDHFSMDFVVLFRDIGPIRTAIISTSADQI